MLRPPDLKTGLSSSPKSEQALTSISQKSLDDDLLSGKKYGVFKENSVLDIRPLECGGFDLDQLVAGPFLSRGRAVVERNCLLKLGV